jgi:hypothetical protein
MNLINTYIERYYTIDTAKYKFVRIVAKSISEVAWYDKYVGEIFIVRNNVQNIYSEEREVIYYTLPHDKFMPGNMSAPVIENDIIDDCKFCKTTERPVNWDDYLYEEMRNG